MRAATPNDPKLSDRGVRRGTCMVGGKAAAEAGAVTHGAVRCSAWLGRVVWRKTVMLFGFNVWNLGKHTVELLATAARGALEDVAVRVQNGDLLGEGRGDELVERNTVVLRERLRAATKRFRNVDVERAHDEERIRRKSSGVTARIPRLSALRKWRVLWVMMKGAFPANASSSTKSSLG